MPGGYGPTHLQIIDANGSPFGTVGNPLSVNLLDPNVFNVKYYGARGDGVTDDTAAILAAIAAAAADSPDVGGVVLFPPGTYKTSASLVMTSDNMILRGSGMYNTIIKPIAGANFDAISTAIPASPGLATFIRNYLGIEQLTIDCSNMTGTTTGQGNGIHWYGVRYSYIRDVFVSASPNWAILLDGDNTGPSQNFGYDNVITRCIFDLSAGGIYQNNCEAQDFTDCRFKWCGGTTAAPQPANGSQDTSANHMRLNSGYAYVAGNVFGKGGTSTSPAILCSNSGPCRIIGNRFDQVRAQAVTMNAGNHEFIGNALGSPCSAALGNPAIQLGNNNNRVIGNSFDNTAGSTHHTYCVQEAGGPFTNNIIADNNFIAGTSGYVSLNSTSTARVHHNPGFNPLAISAPGIPASTTAYTNNFGVDATVFVNGGTVTAVAIGGVATGQIAGAFRVPSAQTITLTYSVAPTWVWFGD